MKNPNDNNKGENIINRTGNSSLSQYSEKESFQDNNKTSEESRNTSGISTPSLIIFSKNLINLETINIIL